MERTRALHLSSSRRSWPCGRGHRLARLVPPGPPRSRSRALASRGSSCAPAPGLYRGGPARPAAPFAVTARSPKISRISPVRSSISSGLPPALLLTGQADRDQQPGVVITRDSQSPPLALAEQGAVRIERRNEPARRRDPIASPPLRLLSRASANDSTRTIRSGPVPPPTSTDASPRTTSTAPMPSKLLSASPLRRHRVASLPVRPPLALLRIHLHRVSGCSVEIACF